MFIICLCMLPAPQALWISAAVWFVGGMQLSMLGVVGEYVGKAYMETKRRPRYIIDKTLVRRDGQ